MQHFGEASQNILTKLQPSKTLANCGKSMSMSLQRHTGSKGQSIPMCIAESSVPPTLTDSSVAKTTNLFLQSGTKVRERLEQECEVCDKALNLLVVKTSSQQCICCWNYLPSKRRSNSILPCDKAGSVSCESLLACSTFQV